MSESAAHPINGQLSGEVLGDWSGWYDVDQAANVRWLLAHSARFLAVVALYRAGADAKRLAVAVAALEGTAAEWVADQIRFAASRQIEYESEGIDESVVVEIRGAVIILRDSLVEHDVMNRGPIVGPPHTTRRRRATEQNTQRRIAALVLLAKDLAGVCLYPGCEEPAGDWDGDPVWYDRQRVSARSLCCGEHATWLEGPRGSHPAVKQMRRLVLAASEIPNAPTASPPPWPPGGLPEPKPSEPSAAEYRRQHRESLGLPPAFDEYVAGLGASLATARADCDTDEIQLLTDEIDQLPSLIAALQDRPRRH